LLLTQQGKLSQAEELFEKTLIQAQKINNKVIYCVSLSNLANINEDSGRFEKAIKLNKMILKVDPYYVWSNYYLSMVFYKMGEIDKAKSILEKQIKEKKEIFYYIGLALVNSVLGKMKQADELLNRGLTLIKTENPDISTKIESFLKVTQFYYENKKFKDSLNFSKKIMELTNSLSKEYNIASAFLKINNFNIKSINKIDIIQETERLKEIGCIYDYAYVKKLQIESMINTDIKQDEIKNITEE
ncbi:unnamed protein product, partial [marine sediment metagenome]